MSTPPSPQPTGIAQWVQSPGPGTPQTAVGTPSTIFLLYMLSLDKAVRNLCSGLIGPLTNATNDAHAAAAGVPINGLYRNGSAVQIRLT